MLRFSIRNSCCAFLAPDGVILQSIRQSYTKALVLGCFSLVLGVIAECAFKIILTRSLYLFFNAFYSEVSFDFLVLHHTMHGELW